MQETGNNTCKFDLSNLRQHTLSIRLSADGFSFFVYNPEERNNSFYRVYPVNSQRSMAANVKLFLNDVQELKAPYRQVNLLIHSMRYTTVPLELFDDDDIELIFYQTFPKMNNEIVMCNVLNGSNIAILFSLDKLAHVFLSEFFPKARFLAAVSPQLELFGDKARKRSNRVLYANLHPESIDVFCFDKGKLLLVNSFVCQDVSDCCFYLLGVWKQCVFDAGSDELYLSGSKTEREELAEVLRKYIRSVVIINSSMEFVVSGLREREELPFDIQSLLTCE